MNSMNINKSVSVYDLMDGMRALAALTVLVSHGRSILFKDATADLSAAWAAFYFITGFGHEAVIIFFVLSGYWITKTVARRSEGGFAWLDYAIDRLSRLWIVLLPALIIGGVLDGIGRYGIMAPIYLGVQGTNALTWDVGTRLSFLTFLGNIGFLQGIYVGQFGSNGPLWSLANEFWYYIWFPPIYHIVTKRNISLFPCVFLIFTMAIFYTLLPGFVCWLFGSLVFCVSQRASKRPALLKCVHHLYVPVLVLFAVVLCWSRLPTFDINAEIKDIVVSGSFALSLFVILLSNNVYPIWCAPICRFGARSSYSLYAIHFPFILFVSALLIAPAHRFPPSGELVLSLVALAMSAVLFASLTSRLTEAKTAALRRWLSRRVLRQIRCAGTATGE